MELLDVLRYQWAVRAFNGEFYEGFFQGRQERVIEKRVIDVHLDVPVNVVHDNEWWVYLDQFKELGRQVALTDESVRAPKLFAPIPYEDLAKIQGIYRWVVIRHPTDDVDPWVKAEADLAIRLRAGQPLPRSSFQEHLKNCSICSNTPFHLCSYVPSLFPRNTIELYKHTWDEARERR